MTKIRSTLSPLPFITLQTGRLPIDATALATVSEGIPKDMTSPSLQSPAIQHLVERGSDKAIDWVHVRGQ